MDATTPTQATFTAELRPQPTSSLELPDVRASLVVDPPFDRSVLALGAELKQTVCLGKGETAWVSGPLADLGAADDYHRFTHRVRAWTALVGDDGLVVAHDLHPTFHGTRLARTLPYRTAAVQHHHAHAVSCAVDAALAFPVIAVVCDGSGFGTDRTIWGGEVLLCEAASFRRIAHLDYFPVPGGDAAARWSWRVAAGVLYSALGGAGSGTCFSEWLGASPVELKLVAQQLASGLNARATSSLGRLFDAVAYLVGVCTQNTHEAATAMALETQVKCSNAAEYPFAVLAAKSGEVDAAVRIDWRPMIREVLVDLQRGTSATQIASRFHATIVAMFARAAANAAARFDIPRVVLSGGCMHNVVFREGLRRELGQRGLTVGVHSRVSAGDAGLSLGQAVAAAAMIGRRKRIGNDDALASARGSLAGLERLPCFERSEAPAAK